MKNTLLKESSIWKSGMMGVAVGDALGYPVQFMHREEVEADPVTGMEACRLFRCPAGTWSDDTSMSMAMLDSIRELGYVDAKDIMDRFEAWIYEAKYCALDQAIDIGGACGGSIERYHVSRDISKCGKTGEHANGNGSLMRNLPISIYYAQKVDNGEVTTEKAIEDIHRVSALTHNHIRACIGCGLYFFAVKAVLFTEGSLMERLQKGMDEGFAFYRRDVRMLTDLMRYGRLQDLSELKKTESERIESSGYVVHTLEAAIWSLITTDSLKEGLLKAVNLADDSDSVGAVAGGLAGLYYGYDAIPEEWLSTLIKREWLESMCDM